MTKKLYSQAAFHSPWYADLWYPIAGVLFLAVGVFVAATRCQTPPRWRSVQVVVMGTSIAVGFAIQLAHGNIFTRRIVFQRWLMGSGAEWHFHQGWVALAAAGALLMLGAVEIVPRVCRRPR